MRAAVASMGKSHLRLLLGLDRLRLASALRRPTIASVVGIVMPAVVLVSALWLLGRTGAPAPATASASVTLGFFVSGTISFLAYGILFGGNDQRFLRELGVGGGPIFLERGIRLLLAGVIAALALSIPALTAGGDAGHPLTSALAAATVTVACAILTYSWAARAVVAPHLSRILSGGIDQFDPALAKAAPLVYAPLIPFLVGAGFGGLAGATTAAGVRWLLVALGSSAMGAALFLGARRFEEVAPLFMPRVGEMAFSPPPEGGGEAFRVGRGLSALLPRRAAAVWVRDATVAGRRFAWASRVTWPVAAVSLVALARWGDAPSTQTWVLTAVGLALLVQSAAVVGLGLLERDGRRWIDRSVGVPWSSRFLGRWAWAWGLSLWLLLPVGLGWSWWSGAGSAWSWPLAGALVAAVATTASLFNAERR